MEEMNFVTRTGSAHAERESRLKELNELRNSLNFDMADHDLLEIENERLHKRLKILANQFYQMKLEHKEESELRKQQCFDVRASMEQIFRQTIKEVDHEYRDRANDKMNKEAEWAREENIRLRKEAASDKMTVAIWLSYRRLHMTNWSTLKSSEMSLRAQQFRKRKVRTYLQSK